jgi:hypothetical protein
MKIKICVEKGNRKAEVPLTEEEVRSLYKWYHVCADCEQCVDTLELNKIKIAKSYTKLRHVVHDIIDEGKVYTLITKGKKWSTKLSPKPHYLVKKPKWQKK